MLGSGCWVLVLGSWFAVLGLDIQTWSRPVEPRTGLLFFERVFLTPPPASVERIEGAGVSMPDLMALLSPDVDRIIVDRTGFNEKFSFQLDFASSALSADVNLDTRPAPSMFEALKEQLGMELRSARGPVEVLVIAHVERPSEN